MMTSLLPAKRSSSFLLVFLLILGSLAIQGCPYPTGVPVIDIANVVGGIIIYSLPGSDPDPEKINAVKSDILDDIAAKGETALIVQKVHFGKIRCEGIGVGRWPTKCVHNDFLIITKDNIYIYENYFDNQKFTSACARKTGSAVLRPPGISKYSVSEVSHIEAYRYFMQESAFRKEEERRMEEMKMNFPQSFSIHFDKAANGQNAMFLHHEIRFDSSGKWFTPPTIMDEDTALLKKMSAFFEEREIEIKDNYASRLMCSYGVDMPTGQYKGESHDGWRFDYHEKYIDEGYSFTRISEECPNDIDFWSSNQELATTMYDANDTRILYIGDERNDGGCRPMSYLDYGCWSADTFIINDCEDKWYRVGGREVGPCKDMDGVKVRRFAVGRYNCDSTILRDLDEDSYEQMFTDDYLMEELERLTGAYNDNLMSQQAYYRLLNYLIRDYGEDKVHKALTEINK